MEQELNLNCFDCKKSLQDCTCMEDTIDMKQETLDEVANEYAKYRYSQEQGFPEEDYYISFLSFIAGARWQQDQNDKEIQDLKNRLNIVRESSEKTIKLVEELQKRSYSEE